MVNTGSFNTFITALYDEAEHVLRILQMTKQLRGIADNRGSCCHPEGLQQAREMGCQEPGEIHQGEIQSPAPEKEPVYMLGVAQLESSLGE